MAKRERILLIGGGGAACQVLDILEDYTDKQPAGILDNDEERWDTEVYGVPVLGGDDFLEPLFKENEFDKAVIAIGAVDVRAKYRRLCNELDIPLINVVDKTVKFAHDVKIGKGNVICAFCHFGVGCKIGDNNFISVYNSYDHHNELGSDISTGPGCMASGHVKLGDRVRLGTGIFIEPCVKLGADVLVASGAVVQVSVPAAHVVKTKGLPIKIVPR